VTECTFKAAFFIIIALISFNCAGQVAPSGGPPDKTPPQIIATFPEPMALNYKENKFSFSFDKYVDRRSFQESFFVSPTISSLSYNWSGTDVEVTFEDTLRPLTTYIITIGTDVLDTRGNRLDKAFSLPFSTGNFIDSCAISGSLIDEKAEGVMIFTYGLDGKNPDTLNPTRLKPDFLTQTGRDGTFLLPYLPVGRYRIMAVRDEYKNLVYDVQTDQFSTYTSDITLTSEKSLFSGVQFKLSIEDTAAPFLSSARSIDQSHVLLRFSEGMNEESIRNGNISLFDTVAGTPLSVQDIAFGEKPVMEVQLVTATQDFGRTYRVKVSGLYDIAGNSLTEPRNSADFAGSSTYDTSRPGFDLLYPPKNSTEIFTTDTLRLFFSEAIRKASFSSGVLLSDSVRIPVGLSTSWPHSRELWLIPQKELQKGMAYTLTIRMDSLADLFGNSYTDSVTSYSLETAGEESMSSISGVVTDDAAGASGVVFITAKNISNNSIPRILKLDSVKTFTFQNLTEGQYTLSAFRDEDGNGLYSFGKPFPFVKAERFTIYGDTLKLRARWPLEGVTVRFR